MVRSSWSSRHRSGRLRLGPGAGRHYMVRLNRGRVPSLGQLAHNAYLRQVLRYPNFGRNIRNVGVPHFSYLGRRRNPLGNRLPVANPYARGR